MHLAPVTWASLHGYPIGEMAAFKYPEALVREHIFSEKTAARTGKNIGVNEKQKHSRIRRAGYAGMQRLKQGSSALLFTHQHIFLFHLS